LVPFFWQTAPFVFLAASARTGIVSLWFHERSFPAAFPPGRNRSVWKFALDRYNATSQKPPMSSIISSKSGASCQEFYPSTHVASTFFYSVAVFPKFLE